VQRPAETPSGETLPRSIEMFASDLTSLQSFPGHFITGDMAPLQTAAVPSRNAPQGRSPRDLKRKRGPDFSSRTPLGASTRPPSDQRSGSVGSVGTSIARLAASARCARGPCRARGTRRTRRARRATGAARASASAAATRACCARCAGRACRTRRAARAGSARRAAATTVAVVITAGGNQGGGQAQDDPKRTRRHIQFLQASLRFGNALVRRSLVQCNALTAYELRRTYHLGFLAPNGRRPHCR
jgi:hypothetical protein